MLSTHAERGEEGEEGAGQLTAVQSHTALDPAEDAGGEEDGAGGELGSAGLVLGVHWEIWDAIEWDKRGSKRGREPSVNEVGSRQREPAMPLRATANTSAGRLPGALARPPRRPVKLFDRLGGLRPAHPQLPNRPPTSPRVLSLPSSRDNHRHAGPQRPRPSRSPHDATQEAQRPHIVRQDTL